MTWEAWFTGTVLVVAFGLLTRQRYPPSVTMVGAVAVLLAAGVISTEQAFAGFGNPAPIAVGALYVIATGVAKTGIVPRLIATSLRGAVTTRSALTRLLIPTATASAFFNNTPIVAVLSPEVRAWAVGRGLSPSWFLLPLSYAAILGGTVTSIGTSTNLIVSGLLEADGQPPLRLFELAGMGLPLAIGGIAILVISSPWLLADRHPRGATAAPDSTHRPSRPRFGVGLAVAIVVVSLVVGSAAGVPVVHLALLGALALVASGALSTAEARAAVDIDVVVAIAASFGLGTALLETGLADRAANAIVYLFSPFGPTGVVVGLVLTTLILKNVVSNNATAVLMFPIAVAAAHHHDLDMRGLATAIAIAASAAFLTPVAYQTNLMVYRPGNYRFGDYARLGLPLVVLVIGTILVVAPHR